MEGEHSTNPAWKMSMEILPLQEPLDDPEFDAVAYTNRLFPTEASLNDLDKVLNRLRVKMKQTSFEIRERLYRHVHDEKVAQQQLVETEGGIQEVLLKLSQMRENAEKTEEMVHNITGDIKILDVAKRNLSQSIAALKRLQMLYSAVHQLRLATRTRQYKEAADLMLAINELLNYFRTFTRVKKIQDLSEQVMEIKHKLIEQATKELEGR